MNIVAVDQDERMLMDLKEKLGNIYPGTQVKTFKNPLDVLKFAEYNEIDLLFTDVRLKPFDGYEMIRALRQKRAFKVYIVSGSRENPDNLNWMNVNGCFSKPVTLEELKVKVG